MSLTFGKLKSALIFLDIAHYKCWSTGRGKSPVFVNEWLMPRSCYNKVMTVCADRATTCVKWQMVWKSFGPINHCYALSRTSLWGSRHLVNHLMSTSLWLSVAYREIFRPSSHILSKCCLRLERNPSSHPFSVCSQSLHCYLFPFDQVVHL